MTKTSFKGSAILNPVPAVLITSKNKAGAVNVFTVAWISTATQTEIQYRQKGGIHE